MGRRALPKIDPTVDLSRWHYVLADLPSEQSLESLFAQPELPLQVEVGTGKGLFMASASRAYSNQNFLGIEIGKKYARFAAYKLAKESRANAVMLSGDARLLFTQRLRTGQCAAVHVYFPDPWWKKRHWRRRIMNESFVKEIERVLIPGGSLHFWTDVPEYFQMALETLATHTTLAGPFDVPELSPEHDLDYRTHFERRMRLLEIRVWRAEFRKRER